MRTFQHIKLIREIANSPHEIIGQRRYCLLKAYLNTYHRFTEVEYDHKLNESLQKMPSIEEYVAKEFGEKHIRTVMFDHYLGWISEDEREHYELCLNRIFKYEMDFPVDEKKYSHILSFSGNLDLHRNFKHILLRPGMYGFNKLSEIRAYLDGYFRFKVDFQLELSRYEKRLLEFMNDWKTKTEATIKFDTWDRSLKKHKMGTTDFTDMFSWEIKRFEDILIEYTQMDLEMPEGWKDINE